MPRWQYADPEVRDYHDFGRLKSGDVVEADERPDERFKPAAKRDSKAPDVQKEG